MKNKTRLTKFIVAMTVVVVAIFFLRAYDLVPFFGDSQAGVIHFSNNHQNLRNAKVVFGPSIRSEDGLTVFDTSRTGLWNKLTEEFNGIEINMLMADTEGSLFIGMNDSEIASVTLSDEQMSAMAWLQDRYDLTVTLSAGIALYKYCDETSPATHGRLAAQREVAIVQKLIDAGVRIDEYNVDGPFFSLVNGSHKGAAADAVPASPPNANGRSSCWIQGYGKTADQAAEIVAAYLTQLQSQTAAAQNGHVPGVNLVINLPNWRVGQMLEMHWGTTPMRNEPSLDEMLDAFAATDHPNIGSVVVDYPFGYINESRILTRLVNPSARLYNNCYSGVPCQKATPGGSFNGKVVGLAGHLGDLNGNPKMSFYVNTSDASGKTAVNGGKGLPVCARYSTTTWSSNMKPLLVPFLNNRCFDGDWPFTDANNDGVPDGGTRNFTASTIDTPLEARIDQAARDKNYLYETIQYYHTIKDHLPRGVEVDDLYFHSWHTNPRYSASWGVQIVNFMQSGFIPD